MAASPSLTAALTRADALEAIAGTPAFTQLAGKRLLVTGGTGFVGAWLLELIAALNDTALNDDVLDTPCRVTILARSPATFQQRFPHLAHRSEFSYIAGDVRTFAPFEPVDLIVHAAAPADPHTLAQNPAQVADTIVSGTRRLLDFAAHGDAGRFLYVSSGIADSAPAGDDLSSPRAVYAQAKRDAEALCRDYHQRSGLQTVIARPFTFIGPYQSLNAGFAVTDFVRDGLQGKPIRVRGGDAVRSYAYGADLARWLLVILLQGTPPLHYNVGSDQALTVLTLAQRVQAHLAAMDIQADLQVEDPNRSATRASRASRYLPDLSQTRAELDLNLRVSLDEALIRTIRWHAAQLKHAARLERAVDSASMDSLRVQNDESI